MNALEKCHIPDGTDSFGQHYGPDRFIVGEHVGADRNNRMPVHRIGNYHIAGSSGIIGQQGAFSVKEVAFAVGFRDPLYFSQVFKASVGLTPSDWASKIRATLEETLSIASTT